MRRPQDQGQVSPWSACAAAHFLSHVHYAANGGLESKRRDRQDLTVVHDRDSDRAAIDHEEC